MNNVKVAHLKQTLITNLSHRNIHPKAILQNVAPKIHNKPMLQWKLKEIRKGNLLKSLFHTDAPLKSTACPPKPSHEYLCNCL